MNVTGIIAEYNPFHNGHLYQLTKAREETDADYMIVVLSGDFVQRGTPAIADKYIRTKTALLAGADLVLELPVYFSSSSADFFAAGAVSLLDKIGCVDHLSFGSEHGSIKELSDIAGHLLSETPSYKTVLKKHLKQGNSYALASAKASMEQFSDSRMAETLLKEPNNTLGIAYLKALSGRNSTITPHTVLRTGGGYHATEKGALSASAVRHTVQTDGSLDSVSAQMPAYAYDLLADTYGTSFPIFENDFSSLLAYKLRTILSNARLSAEDNSSPAHALTCYADVSEELACRIN
ncbi:MAG TPA: nucleotidyltransferase family protein, partial [Lachnospiraceae bacterium]|nr:nucleotidyltransferase family protein [Lachnospiraceae bacterium]